MAPTPCCPSDSNTSAMVIRMANRPESESIVEAILRAGPGSNHGNLKALLRAVSGVEGRVETSNCDLKTAFDGSNQAWVSLAKDIVAMSNSGGGVIVFGIDDYGQRIGLNQSLLDLMDPARINGQIEPKAPGARVNTSYYEFNFYRLRYGFLCIHSQDDLIIFEKEWGYNKPNGRHQTVIREGVLYARGVGETRPARQADVSLMVRRLIETGSRALLSKIEMVATLPLDRGIIALDADSEGRGIRLVDSGYGQPVKIVAESEGAIPIMEVNDADLPFSSKQAEIINQVRIWKAGHPEHRVQRSTLNQWYLARDELEISDDMAEFCFMSAGYEHGYPIYWASVMSEDRLDSVIQREINTVKYPMRKVLPYVVGALRFSQRKNLLASRLDSFQGAIGSATKVLRIASFEEFRCSGRIRAGYFQLLGERYETSDLLDNQEAAQQLYESALVAEIGEELEDRWPLHQLDILLHARDDSADRSSLKVLRPDH